MAGYIIYSLDWGKFSAMVERPTKPQLVTLAQVVADELENMDGEFDDGDPVLGWGDHPKALGKVVAQRLALPDWYGDLSPEGKELWEGVIIQACMNNDEVLGLDYRVDSDGVYWDVIEIAWAHLGVPTNTVNHVATSAFGVCPFRYYPRGSQHVDDWRSMPMHSMHAPGKVRRMLDELRSARGAIEASGDADALEQYTEWLMPAVEQVANDGRLLFIQVDT